MKNSSPKKHALIMAAGTGGHIIPALAVAQTLQQQGYTIDWLGTPHGLENQLVPLAGFTLHQITMQGIRGKGVLRLIMAPLKLLHAMYQSSRIMRQLKPSIVLGFGGFVSAPGGLAAWLLRIPLLIHEQNAVVGMSNRYLAYFAKRSCQAFPNSFAKWHNALTCGNPVREEIVGMQAPEQRLANRQNSLRLLIIGGSQGARALNTELPHLLANLVLPVSLDIRHASGKVAYEQVAALYQSTSLVAHVEPFIVNMAEAYSWAELVVCRSGALTVAELAASGIGSILIPFPQAVDDHQTKNAQHLVDAGAALLLPQSNLNSDTLGKLLMPLCENRQQLINMAVLARRLAKPAATEMIVTACQDVLKPNVL